MARLRNIKPDATPITQANLGESATNAQLGVALDKVLALLEELNLRKTS